MPRNFLRRVELTWPVKNQALRKRILEEILHASFHDDRKAWVLGPDGNYTPLRPAGGKPALRSQAWLLERERQLQAGTKEARERKRPLLRGEVAMSPAREGGGKGKWKPSVATAKRRPTRKG